MTSFQISVMEQSDIQGAANVLSRAMLNNPHHIGVFQGNGDGLSGNRFGEVTIHGHNSVDFTALSGRRDNHGISGLHPAGSNGPGETPEIQVGAVHPK